MLNNAVPLAAAGAVYPVAFAAIVALLGGPEPLRRASAFLIGGLLMSAVGFAVVVVLASSLHVTPRHHPAAAATIKIVLGAALLALAIRTLTRQRDSLTSKGGTDFPETTEPTDTGSARRAFIAGALVYLPGVFLIASAKAVADADVGTTATVLASILCVVVLLAIVEVPIIAFAIAPDRVQPPLERITRLAKAHTKQVLFALEIAGGGYLLASGLTGL